MIASLSAAIGALYKTTDFHPTCNPLLTQVKRALVRLCTTCPIEHGTIFDTSALRNLFLKWGSSLSIQQLCTKLLTMLCVLGHDYATVYPGTSLMALKVVLPELLPPLIFIVILLLSNRYHSRVSPVARLRNIDLHCVVMPSPNVEMLYQAVKYHTSPPS